MAPGLINKFTGFASSKPRVLIPEKVSQDGLALLESSLDIDQKSGLSAGELEAIIGDYEALIVRSETKVTAKLLQAAKKLKVVARAGVGVDNVDVEAATRLGIVVVNSPAGNINAAAEHTVALMLASARNIGEASMSIKSGKWERSKLVGVEMKGKTLSIIGAGKVGLTVARIARGLGMTVLAYDPYANASVAASASVELVPTLAELLQKADFLTIHTPLIASTKGMISTSELASMQPTARIFNVARGGMIDEVALVQALDAGTIAGAGIDVFTSEPPQTESTASTLIAHPKVVATPHLGASTVEAQENVSIDVCEQVLHILSGQVPRSAVNAPIILPEEYRTLQPFVQLVEKIGSLYTQHYSNRAKSTPGHSFRTTFDLTYSGQLASLNTTKPLFAALVKGLLSPISEFTNVNIVNAEIVAKERGILINEQRSRELPEEGYSSLVTLRARLSRSASQAQATAQQTVKTVSEPQDQIISGFVSANVPYISRLGRFSTNFVPAGTLLIIHNYDSPGKIGLVGNQLGKAAVNINFMSVAPISTDATQSPLLSATKNGSVEVHEGSSNKNEALMILGLDKDPGNEVLKNLVEAEGVLDASVLVL